MLDPRSSQLGSTTDQPERHNTTMKIFIKLPPELGCVTCTGIVSTCKSLEVSVSHEDLAISHLREQDYLSLWAGEGSKVELQQALACIVANICKWEREEKQCNSHESRSDPEPCALLELRREETITATHAVDAF